MLSAALSAGLASSGIDVVDLGITTTPGVAYMARTGDFGLGAIVSASHNPAPDNGIKFVSSEGRKTSDDEELEIEGLIAAISAERMQGSRLGKVTHDGSLKLGYRDWLISLLPERLEGLKIAIDASNGAAYEVAIDVLEALGAEVQAIGVSPDGDNINAEGGATKPEVLQSHTVRTRSEIGVAFDGDADRAVFSDSQGRLINGDRTIGIWAAHHLAKGQLSPNTVVGTVMSNGGFELYMRNLGVTLERTPVGDKYVSQRMSETGALVGGEQSGHIVFSQRGPTGDGLVTMLELLRVLRQSQLRIDDWVDKYEAWPQLLVNVGMDSIAGWQEVPKIREAITAGELRLFGHGRAVIRASGTQPMIRVMIEADDIELRDAVAHSIVAAMVSEMGGVVQGRVDLTHALGD